jgi:hypothetical protein
MRSLRWFLLVLVLVACLPCALLLAAAPELPALQPEPAPARDPVEANPPRLVAGVQGQHPRLVFSAADVPALQKLAQGEGKAFFKQMEEYLGSSVAPAATDFLTDDTDGLRQGFWRIPTVSLHAVVTGSPKSRAQAIAFLKRLCSVEHWQLGGEQDSGMGAANILTGAALAYDWLYNDLDPATREMARQKLLLQARRLYYGGHLMKNSGTPYWQNDPQNNHRWHRDSGLALAVLAIAGDGPGDAWLRARTFEELRFIHEWLPEDGTSHESSSYMVFGAPYLTLAMQASDRCFGTHYLSHPYFRNATLFRMHTLVPGLKNEFPYGDTGGVNYFNNYFYKYTSDFGQKDLQDGLERFRAASPDGFCYGWLSLIWYNPHLTGGSLDRVPTVGFYPDLGVALMRDGWKDSAVGAMFKCGPYGGHKLNEYRNRNDFHYVNVAHDDPDANMFTIFADEQLLAADDGYAEKKITAGHNTLLVNGKGQKGEGDSWTQPLSGVDMAALARMTAWKNTGQVVIAEGEAAGMYEGLTRYRRTFIWVRGSYLLLLDDVRAAQPADLTWLIQGSGLSATDEAAHAYRLTREGAHLEFRVLSDRTFGAKIDLSPAESSGKPLGYQQLQLTAHAARWRVATLFDPWHQTKLQVRRETAGEDASVLHVTGAGFSDTWRWTAAKDDVTPSGLQGERAGGFKVTLTAADRAGTTGGPVVKVSQ